MKKNIFTALAFSATLLMCNNLFAQQTTTTNQKDPMKKETTTVTPSTNRPSEQTTTNQNHNTVSPKEIAVKITEWMKVNIGTDEAQNGRINVASTNLLTKLREVRTNVTDVETRKAQIQQAMNIFNAQIQSVLKPEQLEVYKAKRKDFIKDFKEMKDETTNETE